MVARSEAPAQQRPVTRHAALTMLIVVVLAWGFAWPVHKAILYELPPIWAVALRCSRRQSAAG